MELSTKEQLTEQLRKYVTANCNGSQNEASRRIGISNAYISNMLAGKWESISDEKWRLVASKVNEAKDTWFTVPTEPSKMLDFFLTDARMYANVHGICGDTGTGKSQIAKQFETGSANVYNINCAEYFNRKTFLSEILEAMGKDASGYTVSEMMQSIIKEIRQAENPLLILDEGDKLSDQVLCFFITLYNALEGKCGLVIMATDHLKKRIERGVKLNKKGYKEISSRLGRKFMMLPKVTNKDIAAVVKANGIENEETIQLIIKDSEGDLRRVKRLVHSYKI